MKAFQFGLRTVKRYREQRVKTQQQRLARVLRRLEEVQAAREALEQSEARHRKQLVDKARGGLTKKEQKAHLRYLAKLYRRRQKLKRKLAELERREEEERQRLVKRKREEQIMERLRAKKRQEHRKEQLRLLQNRIDEQAVVSHAREDKESSI